MLVVADSSPLIALINIGHIDVLERLFAQVVIPPDVAAELRLPRRPRKVQDFVASPPGWLVERVPTAIEPIPALHAGELAAISLARELKADLLLIDELRGRKAATDRNIPVTGTIGVLEQAARHGLLDLAAAFALLKHTDFWVSGGLLDERLRLFQSRHPKP